jgi:tetratricopeptide (TPR) repeat protein
MLLTTSCSRKKDRFLNRNWHALNTKYNVLFNGEMALIDGLNEIETSYTDSYWDVLPVERLSVKETFGFDQETQSPNFERAEEKAVKAVQTHGMKIKGKEKNTQVDEAYILLGKARYYSGRFIPALDAFNYVLFKYPSSSNINTAKIWRAKTNLRLENESIALENLNQILAKDNLSNENHVEAFSTLAQLYMNLEEIDSALVHLENASFITKDKAYKGRLHFIQGQLYNKKGLRDSAQVAFQKVIDLKRTVPRTYRVNAFLEQISNFDYERGDLPSLDLFLETLVQDRENRPYLDRIYHVMAQHYLTLKKDSIATVYFNKSLRRKSKDSYLNALNYHTIADLNFEDSNYILAGAYYDSTLTHYKENSKPYRLVKKRRDNLEDVILYESIAKENDSILKLAAMPADVLEAYFEDHILRLKAEAEKRAAEKESTLNIRATASATSKAMTKNKKDGGFYFYQSTTVAYGKGEFLSLWGARPLEDNWRWSNKTIVDNPEDSKALQNASDSSQASLTPAFFINQLPSTPKALDSLSKARNFAYYQLGLIYKNKFKDYQRAQEKLEALLKQSPEARLILPAKYNLYKVYTLHERPELANEIKQTIIRDYPSSQYAQILLNPSAILEADSQSPKARYKNLFEAFNAAKYQKVVDGCNLEIVRFEGEDIVPKFELLKASALGRLEGLSAYTARLNYIALNHPNSPEGKEAQNLLDNFIKTIENKNFQTATSGNNFKTIFQFSNKEPEAIQALKTALETAIQEEEVFNLSLSEDVYDINTTFVVIHGLKSMGGALGFAELLDIETSEVTDKPFFAISATNYKTLQIHKNLENYLKAIKN